MAEHDPETVDKVAKAIRDASGRCGQHLEQRHKGEHPGGSASGLLIGWLRFLLIARL